MTILKAKAKFSIRVGRDATNRGITSALELQMFVRGLLLNSIVGKVSGFRIVMTLITLGALTWRAWFLEITAKIRRMWEGLKELLKMTYLAKSQSLPDSMTQGAQASSEAKTELEMHREAQWSRCLRATFQWALKDPWKTKEETSPTVFMTGTMTWRTMCWRPMADSTSET